MYGGEKGLANCSIEGFEGNLLSFEVRVSKDNPCRVLDLPRMENPSVVVSNENGGFGVLNDVPLNSRRDCLEINLTPSPLKYGDLYFRS